MSRRKVHKEYNTPSRRVRCGKTKSGMAGMGSAYAAVWAKDWKWVTCADCLKLRKGVKE